MSSTHFTETVVEIVLIYGEKVQGTHWMASWAVPRTSSDVREKKISEIKPFQK
jgi:hypothetical protein